MKLKSIFIANIAEVAYPMTRLMTEKRKEGEIFEDHAYCDRFVLADSDNRLLITPIPIDKQFFSDTCKILRFNNSYNLWPEKARESICESILDDKKLLTTIIGIIKKNPEIEIYSYAATNPFRKLINFLRKKDLFFKTPEMPLKDDYWTSAFFDSKAGFRQTVSSLNHDFPYMPSGVICSKKAEIIGWAEYYLKTSKGVVMKANSGLAGEGLKIFRREELNGKNVEILVNELLNSEPYWRREPVIVEEFIRPNLEIGGGAPSVEVKVGDKEAYPLYACGMRISGDGVFNGIEIGKGAIPPRLVKELFLYGRKFGKLLHSFGYRGYFDIDWVYSKSDKILPLETNLRRTGGTHTYEVARRLFGKEFYHNNYIVSQIKADAPRLRNKTYAYIKKFLADLLYPINGGKEGIILAVINYLRRGRIGYVAVGRNQKRVAEIEEKFLLRIQN